MSPAQFDRVAKFFSCRSLDRDFSLVMAGLDPAIHVFLVPMLLRRGCAVKTWMPGTRPGMTAERSRHPFAHRPSFPRLGPARRAVAHQAVEVHPDMGGFGGSIGERDGAVERDAGLVIAAKLHQERAAHAEEM